MDEDGYPAEYTLSDRNKIFRHICMEFVQVCLFV